LPTLVPRSPLSHSGPRLASAGSSRG
jgi:hypothetical protein